MVLDRHGQSARRGVERRALWHRPRAQHVADLEAEVEVQRGRIVKLYDKARHAAHGNVRSVGDRRKRLALVAAIMGSFVAGLDSTAVNVALPAIRGDLGGGLAGQQWVSNAYLLALGSLILVGGSLGDVFGERRVFSIGVAGFGVVSLACAVAPTIEVLVACRALQGAFGALLTPSALAVIVAAFPKSERGAAIGSWTAWAG